MRTCSISGFGGSYEWGCQRMLQLGMEWLKRHPTFDFSAYKECRGVYGVIKSDGQQAKELDDLLCSGDAKLREYGATGAMHQAVVGHLAYIHGHGYQAWLRELAQARPTSDFFDFDGTEQSCPPDTVGPVKTLDQMVCRCGHKFIQHALTLEEAADNFTKGDFSAPCKAGSCECSGYEECVQ